MTVAGKLSNAIAIFDGVRSCCLLPSHRNNFVKVEKMGDLFTTQNKSLPRRSSKALEGQLLFCYRVCSACNALSKNFPQMFSCFAVVIVANDIYISTILVQPSGSLMKSLGSVVVVLNVRFTTNGMCVKNNTHIYVAQAIIEWVGRVVSTAACWHSVKKFCAFAIRAFQTQQSSVVTRMWRSFQVQPSQK